MDHERNEKGPAILDDVALSLSSSSSAAASSPSSASSADPLVIFLQSANCTQSQISSLLKTFEEHGITVTFLLSIKQEEELLAVLSEVSISRLLTAKIRFAWQQALASAFVSSEEFGSKRPRLEEPGPNIVSLHAVLTSPNTGNNVGPFCPLLGFFTEAQQKQLSDVSASYIRALDAVHHRHWFPCTIPSGKVEMLYKESIFYPTCTAIKPASTEEFIPPNPSPVHAYNLVGLASSGPLSHLPMVDLPLNCLPEVSVRCSAERSFGFGAKLKSAIAPLGRLDQIATYCLLDMFRSFYATRWIHRQPVFGPECVQMRRFYSSPPMGFCVSGTAPLAEVYLVQWIGRLYVTPFSEPFILGSDQHHKIVAKLPVPSDSMYQVIDLSSETPKSLWMSWKENGPDSEAPAPQSSRAKVGWSVIAVNGNFYKLIPFNAISADKLLNAAHVYAIIWSHKDSLPSCLRPARMLFGYFEVAVEMTFLPREEYPHATDQIWSDLAFVDSVVDALFSLAKIGLLYVDLRNCNVLVSGGRCVLVDYDDCVIVSNFWAMLLATKPEERQQFWYQHSPLSASYYRELANLEHIFNQKLRDL